MDFDRFQLVDRIVSISIASRTIEVEAQVPAADRVFEGHFPGHPLMPGVLLIESMAQTTGWLAVAMQNFERMAFLAAVKEAKLRQFITPGQSLIVRSHVVHEGSGFTVADAEIHMAGKLACNATLTLRHMPFPNPQLRDHMISQGIKIGLQPQVAANG